MNKLLVFPLFIMIMVAFFAIYTATIETPDIDPNDDAAGQIVITDGGLVTWEYDGEYVGYFTSFENYSPYDPRDTPYEPFYLYGSTWSAGTLYADIAQLYDDYGVSFTVTHTKNYNILETQAFWNAILVILAATTALGVTVFGTGLSEFAQRGAFLGIAWGSVWLFLTSAARDSLFNGGLGDYANMIYIALTATYIIGVILEVTGGDD